MIYLNTGHLNLNYSTKFIYFTVGKKIIKKLLALILLSALFIACQGHPSAEEIVKKMNDVYNKTKSFKGVAEFYVVSENGTQKKRRSVLSYLSQINSGLRERSL